MHLLRSALLLGCCLLLPACARDAAVEDDVDPAADAAALAPAPAPGEPDLDAVRAATERFRDVKVALSEGYIPDPSGMCVTAEMEGQPAENGAMGVHYFRPDLLGLEGPGGARVNGSGTHTDFSVPGVLLYEPQADGSLELVGVENLVFRKAWAEAGHTTPPTFHGVEYNPMEDDPATEIDEAHGFEPHYDRHAWLFRENPSGVFEPFNPRVSCAHAGHGGNAQS